MAPGHFPTPLEIGLFFTVWPQAFALLTTLALILPMWMIRTVVAVTRRIRR